MAVYTYVYTLRVRRRVPREIHDMACHARDRRRRAAVRRILTSATRIM